MNDEELPTQPETTPEGATAETAAMNPSSAPDAPPPAPTSAITPEADPTPVAESAPTTATTVCTKHTVVTYDGPSDTLVLRIKRGQRFLVIPELDPIIDSLIANGHIFTQED